MVNLNITPPEGFLEPEERCGYAVTRQSKEIWAVLLDLLNELEKVCQKHDLHFFVDSGTLLGAVREKGFIPWDDDIDVVMLREDYDKLLEIGDSEFKHPYFLQTPYNDEGFLRPHVQLRNSETAAILSNEALKVPFNQGIFLDIFPVDVTSKIRLFNKLKCKLLNFYRRSFGYVYIATPPKTFKGFVMGKFADKCRKDPAKAYRKFDKWCHFIPFKSNLVDKVTFYKFFNKYRYLEKKWFAETLYLPFEFTKVPVPAGYHEILLRYYGKDYMIPKQQAAIHQQLGKVINSTEESYTKILERMRQEKG
ncbi:LicD family protein [Butyrivibrio sp. INlla14]|uniref:LicD family protein n=1 Tax=Butyrivibrio sp. INlla14 TaxID=1520808 RepID=UPI000877208F|nr:LicD family protein [Butyrivibrio sp. INlla14]SCY65027.1 lipopolysaccharide cholinephosphotransferase [Butyrivibrio sp. INlla14]